MLTLGTPSVLFQAGATGAGLVQNTDYALRAAADATKCVVAPLSVKGLRYLAWTLGEKVPVEDLLALACNYLASIAGKPVGW